VGKGPLSFFSMSMKDSWTLVHRRAMTHQQNNVRSDLTVDMLRIKIMVSGVCFCFSWWYSIWFLKTKRICTVIKRTRGGGGWWSIQVNVSDYLGLDICYSPGYLVPKMGSLFPQLKTVAEIWHDTFSRIFSFFYVCLIGDWVSPIPIYSGCHRVIRLSSTQGITT
jgi:hypothetical protein